MKLISYIVVLILLFSIVGCSWKGYKLPSDTDYERVGDTDDAYFIGFQNFDNSIKKDKVRVDSVKQAILDVKNIFHDDSFKSIFLNKSWVASCDGNSLERVSGNEVITDLLSLNIKISFFPKKPFLAIGLTDTINNRIAVDPYRIDKHNEEEIIDASLLIETIAHEFTHMIIENGNVKYRDRGHGKNGCLQNKLVSYRVGKAVQAVWISKNVKKI